MANRLKHFEVVARRTKIYYDQSWKLAAIMRLARIKVDGHRLIS